MKSEDITGGLDLLGDWLDAKGYTEEAGLCTRAMDEINRLRDELADMRERCKLNYELGVERGKMDAEALRAENARLEKAVIELTEENRLVGLQMDRFADEIERLREALRPFADLGMRQAPGSDGDTFIVNIPSAKAIRAARAAMGENDE